MTSNKYCDKFNEMLKQILNNGKAIQAPEKTNTRAKNILQLLGNPERELEISFFYF